MSFFRACVFPLVFNYGHLICNCCYIRHFQYHHFKRFNEYYTNCPKCKAFLKSSDVLTITQQLKMRPNTKVSATIKYALVNCDNSGCDHLISFDNWTRHVKYDCKHRIIQCPANNCPIVGTVNYVITHYSMPLPFCLVRWLQDVLDSFIFRPQLRQN